MTTVHLKKSIGRSPLRLTFLLIPLLLVCFGLSPAFAQTPTPNPRTTFVDRWVQIDAPPTKTSVCVTDNGSGSAVAVFLTGIDHNIYYNTIDLVSGKSLSTWQKATFPGPVPRDLFDSPAACTALNGELYVFAPVRKYPPGGLISIAPDTIYMANTKNGQRQWTDWVPLPSGGTTNEAMAATTYGSTILLFGKGVGDKRVYQNVFSNNAWSGWSLVNNSLTTSQGLATAILRDRLFLFVIGETDNKIHWMSRQLNNPTWAAPDLVPMGNLGPVNSQVAATSTANAGIRLYGVFSGSGGGPVMVNVYTRPTPGGVKGGWGEWKPLPGRQTTNFAPAVASTAPSAAADAMRAVFVVSGDKLYVQFLKD
jgi:hypothetical protein